jgi:hypothetical protein
MVSQSSDTDFGAMVVKFYTKNMNVVVAFICALKDQEVKSI